MGLSSLLPFSCYSCLFLFQPVEFLGGPSQEFCYREADNLKMQHSTLVFELFDLAQYFIYLFFVLLCLEKGQGIPRYPQVILVSVSLTRKTTINPLFIFLSHFHAFPAHEILLSPCLLILNHYLLLIQFPPKIPFCQSTHFKKW